MNRQHKFAYYSNHGTTRQRAVGVVQQQTIRPVRTTMPVKTIVPNSAPPSPVVIKTINTTSTAMTLQHTGRQGLRQVTPARHARTSPTPHAPASASIASHPRNATANTTVGQPCEIKSRQTLNRDAMASPSERHVASSSEAGMCVNCQQALQQPSTHGPTEPPSGSSNVTPLTDHVDARTMHTSTSLKLDHALDAEDFAIVKMKYDEHKEWRIVVVIKHPESETPMVVKTLVRIPYNIDQIVEQASVKTKGVDHVTGEPPSTDK